MKKKKEVEHIEQTVRGDDTFDNPNDLMPIPERLQERQEEPQGSPQASQDKAERASKVKPIYPLTKGEKYKTGGHK